MARPHVPKFGNWDASGGNGQAYTAVFDHARAGKGSKLINPNDPEENEELAAQLYGARSAPPPRNNERPPPRFRGVPNDADESVNRHRHERRSSPEDLDVRRSSDPPGRQPPSYDQPPARRALGAPGGRGGAEAPVRRVQADRDGDGQNHERLPAHANRPSPRETGRGTAPPAWDRRARAPSGGDEGSVMGTAAPKTRLRPQVGREEPPAKGGALPKFGAWDVKDPNAGDGFTMIFQKLSNEKKEGGPVHIPRLNSDHSADHEDSYGKQNHQPVALRSNKNQEKSLPACCTIL